MSTFSTTRLSSLRFTTRCSSHPSSHFTPIIPRMHTYAYASSQTVYVQRGHEHTRRRNWSEGGLERASEGQEGTIVTRQYLVGSFAGNEHVLNDWTQFSAVYDTIFSSPFSTLFTLLRTLHTHHNTYSHVCILFFTRANISLLAS